MIEKKKSNNLNKNSNIKNNNPNFKPKIQDDKLKPLMPTLRQKKRFLRVKIESLQKIEFKDLSENLVDEMILYLGSIDYAKAGIWILRDKFDFEKQEFIIRVSIKTKDKLCASLNLVNKIGREKAKLKICMISGTIKGSYKEPKIKK